MKRGARTLSRFFIEGGHATGEVVTLDPADARKIRTVLRLRDGDAIEAIDSTGTGFRAELRFEGEAAFATLIAATERASEPRLNVTLAQGVPKGQKMDFIVEKTTEVGVSAILPYFSARSLGERAGDSKVARWRRLARSAAQQSGRQSVPEIEEPRGWASLLERFGEFDRVVLAWEVAESEPLRDVLPAVLDGARRVLLVIGPEGGLTHDEAGEAMARGARVVSLGARILRTETAGLVACTALFFVSGDL